MYDFPYYIKLITRTVILLYVCVLLYKVIDPQYILTIDKINSDLPKYVIMTIASLVTLVVGAHFNSRIERKNTVTKKDDI